MEKKFVCNFCVDPKFFVTPQQLIGHQRIHLNSRNFSFMCPICEHISFDTYNAASIHMSRHHSKKESHQKVNVLQHEVSMVEQCIKVKKELEGGMQQSCPYPECSKSFSKKSLFSSHLSRYHRSWKNDTEPYVCATKNSPHVEESLSGDDDFQSADVFVVPVDDCSEVDDEYNAELSDSDADCVDIDRYLAEFYLMLEGKFCLPVTTVQSICEGLSLLSELVQRKLKIALAKELQKKSVSDSDSQIICTNVMNSDSFFNCHHKIAPGPSFTSDILRKKLYKEYFTYIAPVEINLSQDPTEEDHIQYIPIEETLEAVLADPAVKVEVEASFTRERNFEVLSDFTDGSGFEDLKSRYEEASKDLPSTSEETKNFNIQEAIHVFLYQDGYNVSNPLGSAKNKHKEVNMYMSVGNLPPHMRSKDEHCHLVLICNEGQLKKYGYNKVFRKVMRDLKKLEKSGIMFAGRLHMVVLMFILGDNLGQHHIGGFELSFNSLYFCRYCNITKTEFRANPSAVNALRTLADFQIALDKIEKNECEKFEGVCMDSVFNELSWYHCLKPGLPPCFGHDGLLGYIDYDLALIINDLVQKEKWFTYEQLNELISSFKYSGRDVADKPAPVNPSGKRLGGHAVQNWTLFRLLPLIIEDYIKDPTCKTWKLYLQMKDIVQLITAPAIHVQQVIDLGDKITEYLKHRAELFPTKNLKPKHHYLAHVKELILILGPIIHFSTLNFERKHQFFKNVMRLCKNFINVEKTLATRHQWAFMYSSTGHSWHGKIRLQECQSLKEKKLDETAIASLKDRNLSSSALVTETVTCNNLVYKQDNWLVLEYTTMPNLSVAQVKLIIVDKGQVFFFVYKHCAVFDPENGLYVIDESKRMTSCLLQSELVVPMHLSVYLNAADKKVFSLKYSLPSA